MSRESHALTEAFVAHAARQARRDEDLLARVAGTTDDLRRSRAVKILGSDSAETAAIRAAILRRKARQTGALTPDEIERLLAAETLAGESTEIAREAEAVALAAGVVFDLL